MADGLYGDKLERNQRDVGCRAGMGVMEDMSLIASLKSKRIDYWSITSVSHFAFRKANLFFLSKICFLAFVLTNNEHWAKRGHASDV